MLLTRLEPETIPALWPSIQRMLRPALDRDTVRTPDDLFDELTANHWAAWLAHGYAGVGIVVVELADDDAGEKCLFVRYAAGTGRMSRVREALGMLETAARQIGCTVSRIGGRRGWLRALRDYELILDGGSTVHLRKGL